MANRTRIFLTGFMGSGKSTIGPILANVLGYGFVDLDQEIEAREGMAIPDIFQTKGEEAFREIESETLRDVAVRTDIVVALGGGALLRKPNLDLTLASGTLVYLKLPTSVLQKRLVRNTRRPLLRDDKGAMMHTEELTAKIERMIREREPIYECAHITVPVAHAALGHTVDSVAAALRRHSGTTF